MPAAAGRRLPSLSLHPARAAPARAAPGMPRPPTSSPPRRRGRAAGGITPPPPSPCKSCTYPLTLPPPLAPPILRAARAVLLDGLKTFTPTAHSLVLCCMFGPLGVLSHVATRAAAHAMRGGKVKLATFAT